jgi:hypothetical protein
MASSIKAFEVRKVQREFPYRIASGDYFNDFIYIGDEKGTIFLAIRQCLQISYQSRLV